MAILRSRRNPAVFNKENCDEHPSSNLAQSSNIHRSQEDYFTQMSEENGGSLSMKLLQEYSRTENCILGTLSCLDEFHFIPLIQGHSGTAPKTSWNTLRTIQGKSEDDSQIYLHPEAGFSHSQLTKSGPDDTYVKNSHFNSLPLLLLHSSAFFSGWRFQKIHQSLISTI